MLPITFMGFIEQMNECNDLAVAHKNNNGDRAVCCRVLQPYAEKIKGKSDFEPSYLLVKEYQDALKAARFDWNSFR